VTGESKANIIARTSESVHSSGSNYPIPWSTKGMIGGYWLGPKEKTGLWLWVRFGYK